MTVGTSLVSLPGTALLPDIEVSNWLRWYNHAGDRGTVTSWGHLITLVDQVGLSDDWAFLAVTPLPNTRGAGTYVQCCGDAHTGLVVEVGPGPHRSSWLVAPAGAPSEPLEPVGRYTWRYLANPAEMHPPERFMAILLDWLDDGLVSAAYELRDIADRGASRGP